MRNSDCFSNPLLSHVRCDYVAAAIVGVVGTIASVAIGGMGLMAQQSAADQAAANAQAVAQYNAQVQENNAQLALQLATYQAEQNAAVARQQNDLIVSQQKAAQRTSQANLQLIKSQQQVAQASASTAAAQASMSSTQAALEAQISRSNAAAASINAQFARQQAEAAQQRHDAGLENAKQLDIYAEQVQAQQREEARRLRQETETRQGQIRAKYAGSGVTFEGSPLVVLADAAQLAETSVQDAAFISELEARKQQRAADLARFEAGFHLLDKRGFMTQATAFEIQSGGFEIEALGHELEGAQYGLGATLSEFKGMSDVFGFQVEAANERNKIAQNQYEQELQGERYKMQLEAANYDTLIAGERYKLDLQAAELTRFGGAVTAAGYQAQGQASLISGLGDLTSTAVSGTTSFLKSVSPPPPTAGFVR